MDANPRSPCSEQSHSEECKGDVQLILYHILFIRVSSPCPLSDQPLDGSSPCLMNAQLRLLPIAGNEKQHPGSETATFKDMAVIPIRKSKWHVSIQVHTLEQNAMESFSVIQRNQSMLKQMTCPSRLTIVDISGQTDKVVAAKKMERNYILAKDDNTFMVEGNRPHIVHCIRKEYHETVSSIYSGM